MRAASVGLYELWWRALDPCCCLAFLCWFHASFIIHFHTKQTTQRMSAMGTSVSLSLSLRSFQSPSPPFSTFFPPPLFPPLSYFYPDILSFCTAFSFFLFSPFTFSSGSAVLAFSLFFSFHLLPALGWLSSKSLYLFPVNILLLHPAWHQQSAVCCVPDWSANSEFFPRARIQFLVSSWSPFTSSELNWKSWMCNPGLPVKLSTFLHFLPSFTSLLFLFFSFANGPTICLP